MNLFYGKPTGNSFEDILDQFSETSLNSIRTSTVPFLNYWKNTDEILDRYVKDLNLPSKPQTLAFEYPTRSSGSNKASMTDLMILGEDYKIAVEAKFKEINRGYTSLAKWNKENSQNREDVLDHWFKLLKPFTNCELSVIDRSKLPYQFLHRTASSCYQNQGTAITIYQIFYSKINQSNLDSFTDLLNDAVLQIKPKSSLRIYLELIEVELIKPNTKKGNAFQNLKKTDLYSFGEYELRKLS